jgi:mono/diheme cytochrome c family protein
MVAGCQSGAASDDAGPAPVDAPEEGPATIATVADEPSTLDGIFTPAQAARGRQVYEGVCSDCHGTEEWTDAAFLRRWNGESVYRFWYFIYERMPDGEPPYSLPREHVTDVLTYILQLNGLPTGEAELGTDDDSIDDYWLYWSEGPAAGEPGKDG